jgi:putative transposase
VNWHLSAAYIVADCGARLLMSSSDLEELAAAATGSAPALQNRPTIGPPVTAVAHATVRCDRQNVVPDRYHVPIMSARVGRRAVKVVQAYRSALDPTPAQRRMLRSHAGAARFAWNWGLAKCQERYAAEGKWFSAPELQKLWNAEKKADPGLAWWSENSKCAYQGAFRNLDRALRDFVKSRKGERKGRRLGFPKFKKRGKCRDSFRLTGAIHCDRGTVRLPRLGSIRTHEPVLKLARKIDDGTARILSATVSRTAQRWFVSFTVEVERDAPRRHARPGTAVGVDLEVKTLLTGVDDRGRLIEVAGPKSLRAALRKLRRASRAHSRRQPGSAGRRKSAARLARIHARVANLRADALHKATTALAERYERVVVEDLNVAGMVANRRLARAVSDPGVRGGAADAGLQDGAGGRDAGGGGPLVPVEQEVLGLRVGQSQADPRRADLPVRRVRAGAGP